MKIKRYWVYVLHCENNTYYTGYTINLRERFEAHLKGECKYTRSFKPLRVAQCWRIDGDKALAMKIERFIKKNSRLEKEDLILNPAKLGKLFPVKSVSKKSHINLIHKLKK